MVRPFGYLGKIKMKHTRTSYFLQGALLVLPLIAPLITPASSASASPTFSEYPTTYANPRAIVTAGGALWYLNTTGSGGTADTISSITTSGTVTNYSFLPSGYASGFFADNSLAADSSGNVWFAGCAIPASGPGIMVLGNINASTHSVTSYTYSSFECAYQIIEDSISQPVVDAMGNIWVDMWNNYTKRSSVVEFNTSGGMISSWQHTGGTEQWASMVAGPTNSLWAVDANNGQIDQLTLDATTDNVTGITAYTPSSAPGLNITAGPDGNLWFGATGAIVKMTPAGSFTSYALSSGDTPGVITPGPDGALWFTTGAANNVGRATTGGSITEYAVPTSSSGAESIAAGPDNALWFTEAIANKIGRVSAAPFSTEYALPSGYTGPRNMVTAGGLTWYLNSAHGASNRDTLSSISTSGTITNYNLVPSGGSGGLFNGVAVDSSGNLWSAGCFLPASGPGIMVLSTVNTSTLAVTTYTYSSHVCRYGITNDSYGQIAIDANNHIFVDMWNSYTKHNALMEFSTSGVMGSGWAQTGTDQMWSGLIAGPSNTLLATDSQHNQVDQFTLSSGGGVTAENVYTASGTPYDIAVGPDGNLWFDETGTIGKMTPTGTFSYYTIPSGGNAGGLSGGSDGAVWFTEATANKIGRITPTGSITEYPIPTSSSTPLGITSGPDGALWFAEGNVNKIGRLGY